MTATILLAIGDPALRDLVALSLSRGDTSGRPLLPDCEVLAARNGPEALDLAQRSRPHLIVIDIFLPRLNGLEVLRQINRPGMPKVPAIVLSGLAFREIVQQATAAGARDFLVKPFDPSVLVGKAQRMLAPSPAPLSQGQWSRIPTASRIPESRLCEAPLWGQPGRANPAKASTPLGIFKRGRHTGVAEGEA